MSRHDGRGPILAARRPANGRCRRRKRKCVLRSGGLGWSDRWLLQSFLIGRLPVEAELVSGPRALRTPEARATDHYYRHGPDRTIPRRDGVPFCAPGLACGVSPLFAASANSSAHTCNCSITSGSVADLARAQQRFAHSQGSSIPSSDQPEASNRGETGRAGASVLTSPFVDNRGRFFDG